MRRIYLTLGCVLVAALFVSVVALAKQGPPSAKAVPLFNGKTLDGWEGDLKVFGDSELLVTAVANLVSNAVNYSDGGTRVGIGARRVDDVGVRRDVGLEQALFAERVVELARSADEDVGLRRVLLGPDARLQLAGRRQRQDLDLDPRVRLLEGGEKRVVRRLVQRRVHRDRAALRSNSAALHPRRRADRLCAKTGGLRAERRIPLRYTHRHRRRGARRPLQESAAGDG